MLDSRVPTGQPHHLVTEERAVAVDRGEQVGHLVHDHLERDGTPRERERAGGVVGQALAPPLQRKELDVRNVDVVLETRALHETAHVVEHPGGALAVCDVLARVHERLLPGATLPPGRCGRCLVNQLGDVRHPISPRTPEPKLRPDAPKLRPALTPAP